MSVIRTTPYVNFQGHAREAMEFYQQALGGDLELRTIDAQGVARSAEAGERITHARLEADGMVIFGSDGHPSYPPTVGDNMAIALSGADKARLTRIFTALGEGGVIKGALTAQPWGSEVGWLTDRYGVNWMVSIEQA